MSGSKGKTPVTRAQHAEPKRERLAPGPAPAPTPEAAGDAFVDVGFLEDSNALLDKIKGTAENVTTGQVRARLRFRLGVRWARRWGVVAQIAGRCGTAGY